MYLWHQLWSDRGVCVCASGFWTILTNLVFLGLTVLDGQTLLGQKKEENQQKCNSVLAPSVLGSIIKRYKGINFPPQARLRYMGCFLMLWLLDRSSRMVRRVWQQAALNPQRKYHKWALCMLCLLSCWMKIGNMLAVTSAGQHHHSLSEPLPFRASYPTKQTASFSDRTIKAAFLSHKQLKPTSVHLVQVLIVPAVSIDSASSEYR